MKKSLLFAALIAALAIPVATRSAGMDSMQYYVGSWSCQAGAPGKPKQHATVTYTLDGGVLRSWVDVPAQGKMKSPYNQSSATVWDSKKGMYVQTNLDNMNAWSIDYGKMSGTNMEQWSDHMVSSGSPGHASVTRTNDSSFSFTGYPTMTSTKSNFGGTCTKSS